MKSSSRHAALAGLSILLIPLCSDGAIRTVVLSDQLAVGANGSVYKSFENYAGPALNNTGDVVFGGMLRDGTGDANANNETGIWIGRSQGTINLVARQGDQVTDLPNGSLYKRFDWTTSPYGISPAISRSSHISFQSAVWDGSTAGSAKPGIWTVDPQGETQTAALSGQHPPGTPAGAEFGSFTFQSMNVDGDIVFASQLREGKGGMSFQNNDGIWQRQVDGALSLVARDQDPIPGFPAGEKFDLFRPEPSINSVGQIAFQGPSAMVLTPETAFRRLSTPVLSRGEIVSPDFVYPPKINSRGQVAYFASHLVNGATAPGRESGLWLSNPAGELSLLARYGDSLPGVTDAKMGFFLENHLEFNDIGDVVFSSYVETIDGEHRPGDLWLSKNGAAPTPILRLAEHVPGLPDDFRFMRFSPLLNNRGQIAVVATALSESTGQRIDGIWMRASQSQWKALVTQGMSLDIDSVGNLSRRVIDSFRLITSGNGGQTSPTSFNDFGELAFVVTFTDGTSGIFVTDDLAALRGDYNNNGSVGPEDYSVWKASFGSTSLAADGNGDGLVDAADYAVWRDNLGASAGAATRFGSVPEPPGVALVVLAAIATVFTRWAMRPD